MRRAPLAATLIWAALLACAAGLVARATYTADLSAFLPRAPTAGQELLIAQLREGFASRLIMVAVEGADGPQRAAAVRELARRLRADPAFVAVRDGEDAGLETTRAFLLEHRYLLSDAVTPQRFTVAGLHRAIGDTLDLLAGPEGLALKHLFTRDPTGELPAILDSFAPERLETREGVWSSRDGRRALLLAETRAAGSDTDGQQAAVEAVRRAFAAAAAARRGGAGALALRMSGAGVLAVEARATIKAQVLRLSLVSAALIALLLLAVYRSALTVLLGLVPVASGALAGVAAVALGFGVVHGITLGFGVTLIGEAVDYSIYLFIQSRSAPAAGRDGTADAAYWQRAVWPTIRLGMLTSVCGFAALLPSHFQGLAQLGLYSIAGLAAAALVTRFVLPAWAAPRLALGGLEALGEALARALERLRSARSLLAALPLLALLALYAHRGALFSEELASLSPIPEAEQALDAALRADLGAPDARFVVAVSAGDREAALAGAEAVAERLAPLAEQGVIGGFDSPARYLPSLAAQQRRRASLPAPEELAARLPAALAGLPVSASRLAPFVQDVARARTAALVRRADLEGTALAAGVDALLSAGARGATAFLPLRAAQAGDLPAPALTQLRAALAQAAPGALLLDLKGEADRLYAGYLHEALVLALAGFGAIVLLLLAAGLSPLRVARVLAPLALAVVSVAGAAAALGERLTILHVVGMLLIVAVGSNYALFFDRRSLQREGAMPLTLASLAVANLATVLGFGVLAFSSVPVLADLGRTVAPGALLALVFAALLSGPEALAPAGPAAAPPGAGAAL
jgi:predicted exporter